MRKPHKVDVSLDSDIDLESLSRTVSLDIEGIVEKTAQSVVAAYVMIKVTKTLCSAFEHVVVTKVK